MTIGAAENSSGGSKVCLSLLYFLKLYSLTLGVTLYNIERSVEHVLDFIVQITSEFFIL